ncbi:MAG: gfo/Idh/MocA family oxidoreductase, partial [Nitrosopumilaceae archaeon]|nr:gfo/Idh/MocA family oxidoreductase [Nitrosopumilaceae archaeon]
FKAGPTDHFIKMVDSFCKEISGIEKSSYNFEQDLLDQAKLMESLRLSNKSKKRMYLTDL